jgi:hypothetical protein
LISRGCFDEQFDLACEILEDELKTMNIISKFIVYNSSFIFVIENNLK